MKHEKSIENNEARPISDFTISDFSSELLDQIDGDFRLSKIVKETSTKDEQ